MHELYEIMRNDTRGGGLYVGGMSWNPWSAASFENVVIANSSFKGNSAHYGGAIYLEGDASTHVHIHHTDFESNRVVNFAGILNAVSYNNRAYGGAIYKQNGELIVDKSYFFDNTVQEGSGGGGGALYIDWGHTSVFNSRFYMNKSPTGGALSLIDVSLLNMTYTGANHQDLRVYNSDFYANEAKYGSAIYGIYGKTKVAFSSFFNNKGEGHLYMYNGLDMTYSIVNSSPNQSRSLALYKGKVPIFRKILRGTRFGTAYLDVKHSCLDADYKGILNNDVKNPENVEFKGPLFEAKNRLLKKIMITGKNKGCMEETNFESSEVSFEIPEHSLQKLEQSMEQSKSVPRGAMLQ
jgi:hypothetical protein